MDSKKKKRDEGCHKYITRILSQGTYDIENESSPARPRSPVTPQLVSGLFLILCRTRRHRFSGGTHSSDDEGPCVEYPLSR